MAMTCQALYNSEFAKYFVTLKYSIFVILKGSVSVKLQNLSFCNINILFLRYCKRITFSDIRKFSFCDIKKVIFCGIQILALAVLKYSVLQH